MSEATRIEVRIGTVAVEGMDAEHAAALCDGLTTRLSELFRSGSAGGLDHGISIPEHRAEVDGTGAPRDLGGQIAYSVFDAVSRP
jgi:hypothetical protein